MTTAAAPPTNYRVLALLGLLFFGPLVVAILLYFGGGSNLRPSGSVAHGILLATPGQLPREPVPLADGESVEFQRRWALIYVHGGACGTGCQEGLYRTRQVRKALGKENFRVQRYFVTTDEGLPDPAFLTAQHPELRLLDSRVAARGRVLGSLGEFQPGDVFIADPLGNVILRFPADTPMKDMHQDLSLLLKASQIG